MLLVHILVKSQNIIRQLENKDYVVNINYLCGIDSTFKFSDQLFEFKGPVVISDVYTYSYINESYKNEFGDLDWSKPKKNPAYDSGNIGNKQDALEQFKRLKYLI